LMGAAPAMPNKTVHAAAALRANLLRRFVHGRTLSAMPVPEERPIPGPRRTTNHGRCLYEGNALMNLAQLTGLSLLTLGGMTMTTEAEDLGPDNDYGRSRIWGNHDILHWEPLFKDEDLESWKDQDDIPVWSRDGDTIVATAAGRGVGPLVQGDATWQDYEVKVKVTVVSGASVYVQVRKSEEGHYQLAFLPGAHAFAIARFDPSGRTKLDVVDHVIKKGQEYDVRIAVRGDLPPSMCPHPELGCGC
jgi:hypothetical protein